MQPNVKHLGLNDGHLGSRKSGSVCCSPSLPSTTDTACCASSGWLHSKLYCWGCLRTQASLPCWGSLLKWHLSQWPSWPLLRETLTLPHSEWQALAKHYDLFMPLNEYHMGEYYLPNCCLMPLWTTASFCRPWNTYEKVLPQWCWYFTVQRWFFCLCWQVPIAPVKHGFPLHRC